MTTILTHEEVTLAQKGFTNIAGFSFREPQVRHSIRRNLRELNPLSEDIKATLDDIRNEQIKKGKDGKPRRKRVAGGQNGQELAKEGGWDWVSGGQATSEILQRAFLDKEMEIRVYSIEDEWLTPCWRYYVDRIRSDQSLREEYYLTYKDTRHIEYAIAVEEEEEEPLEHLDKQEEEENV
ncbi:hypothetical protein LCGC14_2278950 [marine sediment metagenome]|uniref:Uncharacterized protein n=1 Tax=marine sediment metagenome TaxID=412755 RepID=A0A0F9F749_9ZZZZ